MNVVCTHATYMYENKLVVIAGKINTYFLDPTPAESGSICVMYSIVSFISDITCSPGASSTKFFKGRLRSEV